MARSKLTEFRKLGSSETVTQLPMTLLTHLKIEMENDPTLKPSRVELQEENMLCQFTSLYKLLFIIIII